MIKATDDGKLEINGKPEYVLSQLRAIIEAIVEIPETKILFEKNMEFFNPKTSDKRIKEIVFEFCEEVYKN